jgi:REP element-mobilizing transposase RayT
MRKPRLLFPGGLYHVIARGNQRQKTFWAQEDFRKYLQLLGEHLESREIRLYAYCLMPNHLHLLLEQGGEFPLSRFMHRLQSAYTQYFNRKRKKVGHLFQGRYKAILVDRDCYLLELVRYIQLNPFRAKLEEKPGQYPWTSHKQYLGQEKPPLAKVEVESVLGLFAKRQKEAQREYVRFVRDGTGEGHREDLYEVRHGHILGDQEFVAKSHEKARKPLSEPGLSIKRTMEEMWRALLQREGLKEEPRGHQRSRLMEETAYLAFEAGKKSQREIGEYFGINQSAVSLATLFDRLFDLPRPSHFSTGVYRSPI